MSPKYLLLKCCLMWRGTQQRFWRLWWSRQKEMPLHPLSSWGRTVSSSWVPAGCWAAAYFARAATFVWGKKGEKAIKFTLRSTLLNPAPTRLHWYCNFWCSSFAPQPARCSHQQPGGFWECLATLFCRFHTEVVPTSARLFLYNRTWSSPVCSFIKHKTETLNYWVELITDDQYQCSHSDKL